MLYRLLPITLMLSYSLFCENIEAQSLNVTLQDNWDDNTLPASPHGINYNDIWGYADNGREYAILGGAQHTIFFDVTDPTNIIEVSRIAGGSSCTWRDFKVYGQYAYGVADNCNAGLEIFDLSNLPSSVSKVYDSRSLINNAHNIFIDTTMAKLYACGVDDLITDITILSLSNPASPTLISNLDLNISGSDYIHDLYVKNDTAYLSNGSKSLMLIYDLSNPGSKVFIASIPSNGYNHSSWVSDNGQMAIIADETKDKPLKLMDISDLDSPQQTATIKSTLLAPNHTNSIAHNPFILGNDFAVISYYDDGVQIYKIDSMHIPFRAGYYDTDTITSTYAADGAWGTYPFLPSGNVLVSDIYYGLFIVKPGFPLLDCQKDVDITGVYDHHWDIISQDSISVNAVYENNATLTLDAPESIILEPGFSIESGSTLEAAIAEKCNNSSMLLSDTPIKYLKKGPE